MAPIPLSWIKNLGRNGWDRPIEVGLDKTVEARNVYLYKGGLGTRRGGSTSITTAPMTPPLFSLIEYIKTSLAAAELWTVDNTATIFRSTTSATFAALSLVDAIIGSLSLLQGVTLNQKLYLAYQSGVNRLHVFDPNNPTTNQVRATGLISPSLAPAAANTGAGTYPATLRYYRTRIIEQQSGITTTRSEPSASVSFTPSGSGTGVVVTIQGDPGEHETHWEVEGSTDNITFYVVAGDAAGALSGPIAIATGTYTDTSTPSTWGTTLTASAPSGTYSLFPAVKCLGTTGTRLYGFGVWTTFTGRNGMTPKNGRLYFTPALDTTTTNDDERISNTTTVQGFIDASRNAGSVDRGCAPKPVNNVIFCFQDRGVYAFYPTESNITPYRRVIISTAVGNLAQQAIVVAVDHAGRAACYFWDPVLGPYMVGGYYGLAWVGKDVADIVATVNRDASILSVCGEWYPDRSQIVWLVATNGANSPNFAVVLDPSKMTYDAQAGDFRGGWTTYDGPWVNAYCIRAFSNTLAATRSSVRTPYTGTATKLLRYDETVNQDDTTPFQAYVTSGSQAIGVQSLTLQRAYTIATAQTGVQIQQSLIRNTGDEANRTSKVDLTPIGAETMVLRKFEDAALRDAWTAQVTLGDAAAQNVAWQIMQWRARMESGPEL